MNQSKKRFDSIDLFKFIASLLVITIHINPLLSFGDDIALYFVSTLPRLAVPFFFACSGFFFFKKLKFCDGKIENCKSNRKILYSYVFRIGILYIVWSFIYLLWSMLEWKVSGWLSINAFIDFGFAFFKSNSYFHLWYILDLIYATVLGYVVLSLINRKFVLVLGILLYILGVIVYSYYWISAAFGVLAKIPDIFPALWDSITRAFPFMMIGYGAAISKKEFSKKINLIMFTVSFVFLIIEIVVLNLFTINDNNYSYIVFSIPCAYFLFITIKNMNISLSSKTSILFRNMSTLIYCVHPLFIGVLGLIVDINEFNSLLAYLIIVSLSVLFAYIITKLSDIKYLNFLKYIM